MTNTRKWLMILILPFIFASSSALAAFADNLSHVCEKSSGSIIKVYAGLGAPAGSSPFKQAADTSNDGDQCSEIPDAYRINIYKFGTCTADPFAANDFSTCSYFIDSEAPVVHTIQGVGAPTPLATTGVIAPGTYGYGFMILDNSLEVKHTQTYDTAMFSNPDGGGIVSGTTCWSIAYTTTYGGFDPALRDNGSVTSTGIECGTAADAAPAFTKEIFDSMGGGFGEEAFTATDATSYTQPSGDSMKAKLLQADNISVATGFGDAKRIFARVDFATDKVVTASSKFEIKFKLTDAVSVDSGFDGANQYIVKMGADPFQVDVVVTD
ncbi:hypothetical protein [Porticoccus sp. Uisw_050_02]|uniref:hypothetical protein n=1 Tax=Porticoccus sp. Uisw_050_02 TaxID=3230978 RepID=UPI0039EB6241